MKGGKGAEMSLCRAAHVDGLGQPNSRVVPAANAEGQTIAAARFSALDRGGMPCQTGLQPGKAAPAIGGGYLSAVLISQPPGPAMRSGKAKIRTSRKIRQAIRLPRISSNEICAIRITFCFRRCAADLIAGKSGETVSKARQINYFRSNGSV